MNGIRRSVIVFSVFISCFLYGQQTVLLTKQRPQFFGLNRNSIVSSIQKHPKLFFAAGVLGLAAAAAWKYKISDVWASIQLGEEVSNNYYFFQGYPKDSLAVIEGDLCSAAMKKFIKELIDQEYASRKEGIYFEGKWSIRPGDFASEVRAAFIEGFVRQLVWNKKLSNCLLQQDWLNKNFTKVLSDSQYGFASPVVINKILVLTQRGLARRELKQLYKDKRYRQRLSGVNWSESIARPYFVEELKKLREIVHQEPGAVLTSSSQLPGNPVGKPQAVRRPLEDID